MERIIRDLNVPKYYSKKYESLKETNSSRWWKDIKNLGGLTTSGEWHQQLITEDIQSTDQLVENFNIFLVSLTENFKPLTPDFCEILDVPPEFLISTDQAYEALRGIKINKAIGPDMIPNMILKEFAYELAPVFTDIYNTSLKQGTVPQDLKRSIVRPLPKCHPPKSIENDLRPIALTSQIAKLMEGFTLKSLHKQINHLIDPKQFAVSKKSTTHALLYYMHVILEALDRGNCSVRVFFADFKKGFDLVDHNVLINELHNLGVHKSLVQWIRAFLTERQQAVKIGVVMSSWMKTNGGIPQGTKLGPLLFAVLVNSLLSDWQTKLKFVDDTTAIEIIPRCSPSIMPLIVNSINEFSSTRGMKLNPLKCKEMIVNFLQYRLPITSPMYIGDTPIDQVNSYKLLGLYVTSDLSWNVHIDYICKKANSRLYALRLLKKSGLNTSDLIKIYCSLVRSVLEYVAPVWSNLPDHLSRKIESLQKRALRIVYPEHCYQEALQTSCLPTLSERRETICKDLKFNLKMSQNISNPLISIIKPLQTRNISYNLRSTPQQVNSKIKTDRFRDFFTNKNYKDS